MILKDARELYYSRTAKLSDVVRQLDFAGIAIIWIFKTGKDTGIIGYGPFLLWPLAFLVGSLAFDLLQYLYASAAWGIFHRRKEKQRVRSDQEFKAPPQINWPTNFFFWGKAALCITGYILLLIYIAQRL